jgi:predicted lipid-binding transport protein (Tim44 family)
MKMLALLAAVLILGVTLAIGDAEAARRLGAGKSSGMQRQMNVPDKAPTTASSNAVNSAAAPQAQPRRSWMGPIAGLAAGLGLAALASHFGFGDELASMLMIGLLVMAVMVVVGMIMRRRAAAQLPAMAGVRGMQYAGSGVENGGPATRAYEHSAPGSASPVAVPANANIPADFDVAGFVRNAKVHFIRLQAANDAGNLADIGEFTTQEMFAELKMNLAERNNAVQETDVVSIEADVIEVAEETGRYVVSVRFTGLIREDKDGPVESIDEIWHLVKPRDGKDGWRLAGIQQLQ